MKAVRNNGIQCQLLIHLTHLAYVSDDSVFVNA